MNTIRGELWITGAIDYDSNLKYAKEPGRVVASRAHLCISKPIGKQLLFNDFYRLGFYREKIIVSDNVRRPTMSDKPIFIILPLFCTTVQKYLTFSYMKNW